MGGYAGPELGWSDTVKLRLTWKLEQWGAVNVRLLAPDLRHTGVEFDNMTRMTGFDKIIKSSVELTHSWESQNDLNGHETIASYLTLKVTVPTKISITKVKFHLISDSGKAI